MTFFRYWNYTTCIEFKNFNILEQKVTQLLETEEGCRRLSQIPELKYTLNQLLNHPLKKLPNLWIIGLFEGTNQWTIIKTFPPRILCRRASNANRPRLSNLIEQTKCNAFHLELLIYIEIFKRVLDAGSTAPAHMDEINPIIDTFYLTVFAIADKPSRLRQFIGSNQL